MDISSLVRKNILSLKPYSSAREEYTGGDGIFLDANENPFGNLNRYPDPYQRALKEQLSRVKNIPTENIFIGNGSDEVIDLALRIFCRPGHDQAIVCPPTYGIYEVSAGVNDIAVTSIPLDDQFRLNVERILSTPAKIIFLCSPNNPTGNLLDEIEKVIAHFKGIVFVDEAYIDFSNGKSLLQKVKDYPNLVVSQTLSKAWGRAAIRIGMAYAGREIINWFNKIKPPYNISSLNQAEAIMALEDRAVFNNNRQIILEQRTWLENQLGNLSIIEKIYPSDANFLLVKTKNAGMIYKHLVAEKIIVRNRHSVIGNCLRITVGTPGENERLIQSLKEIVC